MSNRTLTTAFFVVLTTLACGCDSRPDIVSGTAQNGSSKKQLTNQFAEAACGQCQFGMEGSGCDLAIRVDDQVYFVDGTGIDDHGDAHGDSGLCNCIRKATVTGEIKDGRFVATQLELQSETASRNE